ncbi:Major Facilitator Superfamily protein [Peptoniphilus asaccharolyticus DSM 20463]|uniref:Major Facilitator Superfamily protein n=1 Tax=Peptoniphilus asaccharolyticus DSM 20463 TaxID=573058 RepID=A0A1W1V692_PEPAS|nr:MFS transporter [Peptoniphilus asaccharolyticus]MBL7575980.1 MFS transporter [Peptoniphilus asaccharolyticus]SMB88927.1 Major Facilitator Superfamily protein [Peptoniphilus asaccharolyticus DSM 20463]
MKGNKKVVSSAMAFIFLMGIVSLFSDMTHEGARSILGEFLNLTGASATTIGFVSGIGELLGYSLRIVSGFIADKTKKYWTIIIVGYSLQVLAIPALAFVPEQGWIIACVLIALERIGKAIKKPAKNTLVSFAASEIGVGKGFAYQEFLDQLGAFIGPVILFLINIIKGTDDLMSTYRLCFIVLGTPAVITISLVLLAKLKYHNPEIFEKEVEEHKEFSFQKSFVLYMVAICLFAFGFADFTIITFHVARVNVFDISNLSLLYALAMAVDAIVALFFGWLFDKVGLKALIASTFLSAFFSAFIFLTASKPMIITGVVLWGIGMGAQESIMKAEVSKIIPKSSRSMGFGIFETGFGVAWFLESWILGYLYDVNITYLVVVSIAVQILAIVFYGLCIFVRKEDF